MKTFTTFYIACAYRNEFTPHHEIEYYKFRTIVQSICLETKFYDGEKARSYAHIHTEADKRAGGRACNTNS